MPRHSLFAFLILFFSAHSYAAAPNAEAPVGGSFTRNMDFGGEPATLHPIMASDIYADDVHNYVFDSLVRRDPETFDWKPRLAEKWEISKDGKTFTFFLRKNLKFHDGKPITADDVKFSYDAIFEKSYNAIEKIPYYENIDKVEVIDPATIRFTTKNTYFQNFNVIASYWIIPKHIYGDLAKSKKMSREVVGSGPYRLDKFQKGQRIVMKRFADWYGFSAPEWKGAYNFETVTLKFISSDNVALEMTKKKELDFQILSPEYYEKKTDGKAWGKTVFKYKVENNEPKSFGFIGWNFRRDLFQDKNVRVALAHMMNREEMNSKFRFGNSRLATGPFYSASEYANPNVKPILFDPKVATELLTKAGWKDTDGNGVLDKEIGGKKTEFRFKLLYSNRDSEKYWTMFHDDLLKIGIDIEVKYLEWNAFIKMVDEGNFDAVAMAWQNPYEWDPKQIWHSSSAVPGGSNFINYKNSEVDKLIDQARFEMDKSRRVKLMHKIYELIADDAPYIWMFNDRFTFYATSDRVEKPADTFKYEIGHNYWWAKPKQ